MKNFKMSFIAMLVLSLVMLIGCGKKETGDKLNYEIKTVAGVKVFANDKIPSIEKIEMNFVEKFTINGDVEDELQSFVIQQPTFDIDKEGNIYVVDIKSSSLKKFDKDGNFVTQLGRKGNGPGEFFMPMSVITANDTIYGFDAMMKINKYDM
ncbi:MAG: 6-bladed beta-propeller, partial [Candidatus Delongbacteria bacterium]|nr:6-bladed beta-propeller [Candidatus Delongbacteria bacterium]